MKYIQKCLLKLNIGNKVLTKSNTWQRVVKKFDNGVQDIYMLNAYGTAGIECTKEHKFYAREMYRNGFIYREGSVFRAEGE